MKSYTLQYLDTCLPDYFRGYHNPVIAFPVTSKSTYGQIKEDLLYWQNTEHIDDLDDEAFNRAVESLLSLVTLSDIPKVCNFIPDYGDEDEDEYEYCSSYMFFGLDEICEEEEEV